MERHDTPPTGARGHRPATPPPPATLARRAAELEATIAARRAERLETGPWEKALESIRESVARHAAAWADARADLGETYDPLDPKHNLPPAKFRERLIAFARRREQPVCQRCLGRWARRALPVRITNAEGDTLLVHDTCVADDDEIE